MRILLSCAALGFSALVLTTPPARAQDPVRLPEVIVKANIDKPGPKRIAGIVVDTGGIPIADAEITIPDLARRLYSRGDGSFRFENVPKGNYSMRARKLGFAPQVRLFEVDTAGGIATFALLPIVKELPAMLTTAGQRGISGHVEDMNYEAIPGATVRLLGKAITARTNDEGDFFVTADPGRYMLSIARDSFTTKLVGVTVPKDSGRHVNAWLAPSFGPVEKVKVWNIEDLRERQAWMKAADRVLFTREDLAHLEVEWIADAVATTSQRFGQTEPYSRDCMVVVDGGPEIANLSTLTVDEVESVEVYPVFPRAPTSDALQLHGPVSKGIKNGYNWLSNTRFAEIENRIRHCPGVYVWMR